MPFMREIQANVRWFLECETPNPRNCFLFLQNKLRRVKKNGHQVNTIKKKRQHEMSSIIRLLTKDQNKSSVPYDTSTRTSEEHQKIQSLRSGKHCFHHTHISLVATTYLTGLLNLCLNSLIITKIWKVGMRIMPILGKHSKETRTYTDFSPLAKLLEKFHLPTLDDHLNIASGRTAEPLLPSKESPTKSRKASTWSSNGKGSKVYLKKESSHLYCNLLRIILDDASYSRLITTIHKWVSSWTTT